MRLNSEHLALLPTSEDIAFYQEHGWYISKKIFSDEEIDALFDASERYYIGERDARLPAPIKSYLDWTPDQGDGLRLNDYIVLQSQQFRQFSLNPLLGAIAARLSGSDQIRLFNSSLVYKPPRDAGEDTLVGWHVDRAYWKTCTSNNMLTAWIPFHDCNEQMGTLTVIDSSHRWPDTEMIREMRNSKTFLCNDFNKLECQLEECEMPIKKVPIILKKGQVSFHHCLTFHGSGLNRSTQPRRCLILHMQDQQNQYRVYLNPDGQPYVYNNDLFCCKLANGYPDYSDPLVCPVLWEEEMSTIITTMGR